MFGAFFEALAELDPSAHLALVLALSIVGQMATSLVVDHLGLLASSSTY